MGDDTRTLEERYEDMKAERDELEQKVFTLACLLSYTEHHEYVVCAVNDCRAVPDWEFTQLPLCRVHLFQAAVNYTAFSEAEPEAEDPPERLEYLRKRDALRRSPAVYYIQMNENIKIGTTIDLSRRLADFSARSKDLLAVEPGGKPRERERHLQFGNDRVDRGELFVPSPALLAHIATVRSTFGDPAKFLGPDAHSL